MPHRVAGPHPGTPRQPFKPEPTPSHFHNDWSVHIRGSGQRGVAAGKKLWELREAVRGFQRLL